VLGWKAAYCSPAAGSGHRETFISVMSGAHQSTYLASSESGIGGLDWVALPAHHAAHLARVPPGLPSLRRVAQAEPPLRGASARSICSDRPRSTVAQRDAPASPLRPSLHHPPLPLAPDRPFWSLHLELHTSHAAPKGVRARNRVYVRARHALAETVEIWKGCGARAETRFTRPCSEAERADLTAQRATSGSKGSPGGTRARRVNRVSARATPDHRGCTRFGRMLDRAHLPL
jgi:hypothetical protein